MADPDKREGMGLRAVINCSGTMTGLGASIAVPEAIAASAAIMDQWVEMADLQRIAGRVIARLTGAEAGCATASCSAGITLAVAAAMTGRDLAAIERLPDARGLKDEVVIQAGHMVNYGAPVEQAIRLAGAKIVPVGQATEAHAYQLAGSITDQTAAAVFIVSHHAVHYGQIPLKTFCETAHARGVPVIVDAASEYDLTGFFAAGADIVLYSGHKFLGGPTSGIIAGRKDLVSAAYLHNRGIGRGMKIGKESIAGLIAALEAWERRDHAAIRARERAALTLWQEALADRAGLATAIDPDPTGNPLDRLKVRVDPAAARISAWDLADRLAQGARPVIVRDHELDHGFFHLDPCNLHPGEAAVVAERLAEELDHALGADVPIVSDFAERLLARERAVLAWPD